MKRLSYITLIVFIMFVGINSASAKNVEKECFYFSDELDAGLKIYDDNSAEGSLIKYKDTGIVFPLISVNNWSSKKSIYSSEKKCPNYALVTTDGNLLNTKMFVSNDKNELTKLGYGNAALIGTSTEYDPEGGEDHAEDVKGLDKSCYYASDDNETRVEVDFRSTLLGLTTNVKILRHRSERPNSSSGRLANQNEKLPIYKQNKKCFESGVIFYLDKPKTGGYYFYLADNNQEATTIYNDILNKYSTEFNDGKADAIILKKSSSAGTNPTPNPVDPDYKYGCEIFGDTLIEIIHEIYGYFKWIIPVLVAILSVLDFIKVVGTGKDDDFKKAQNNLVKRVVLAIVFFLVPALISFIINLSGITEQFTNGDSIIEAVTCILG